MTLAMHAYLTFLWYPRPLGPWQVVKALLSCSGQAAVQRCVMAVSGDSYAAHPPPDYFKARLAPMGSWLARGGSLGMEAHGRAKSCVEVRPPRTASKKHTMAGLDLSAHED